jgi:hypothetical protein
VHSASISGCQEAVGINLVLRMAPCASVGRLKKEKKRKKTLILPPSNINKSNGTLRISRPSEKRKEKKKNLNTPSKQYK